MFCTVYILKIHEVFVHFKSYLLKFRRQYELLGMGFWEVVRLYHTAMNLHMSCTSTIAILSNVILCHRKSNKSHKFSLYRALTPLFRALQLLTDKQGSRLLQHYCWLHLHTPHTEAQLWIWEVVWCPFTFQYNGYWDLLWPSRLRTTSDFLCIHNMQQRLCTFDCLYVVFHCWYIRYTCMVCGIIVRVVAWTCSYKCSHCCVHPFVIR